MPSVSATGIYYTKKDFSLGTLSGLLIGLLLLPIMKAAKPEVFEKIYIFIVPFFLIATPLGLAIAYLIGKKISFVWQVAKFGVTGVLNTLVDIGSLALITFIFRSYLGIDSTKVLIGMITFYSIFKAASFIIANVNSFYWNKYWTFSAKKESQTTKQFLQFFVVSIVGFVVNVLVASFVFKALTMGNMNSDQIGLVGAAVGSIAGLAWNFIGYKFIVFKK